MNIKFVVLKNATVAIVLTKYFNLVFSTGCLSTSWLRSIIKPISKGAGKDPNIPINYRGISLISCVDKLYSAVLNDRLVEYLELLNLIADEQNGFRKDRYCEDHVFVLDSVVKNRLNNGQSTYVSFVDMAKAFDWVNRPRNFSLINCYCLEWTDTFKNLWRQFIPILNHMLNLMECVQIFSTQPVGYVRGMYYLPHC